MEETRRWQLFTEGSWEFTGDLRLSGELLLAETDVPHWGTSPSYPPSEVIDLARINGRHYGQEGPPRGHPRHSETQRIAFNLQGAWRGAALQNLDLYPCRGGPAIVDCTSGRTGVFIYLPPGYEASADRGISAVFGEAELPLGFDLNAQLSLRYEHYRQQGLSSLDPRLAVRWQARPGLTLRASAGTAFRAPTINQIEPGIATTSRQFIGRIGTFKPIRALGNPELQPESVSTFNAGAIYDFDGWRSAGDHTLISADFWRYDFENPLVLEPYVRVLDLACPAGQVLCAPDSPYYDPLTHNPLGRLVEVGLRWEL